MPGIICDDNVAEEVTDRLPDVPLGAVPIPSHPKLRLFFLLDVVNNLHHKMLLGDHLILFCILYWVSVPSGYQTGVI